MCKCESMKSHNILIFFHRKGANILKKKTHEYILGLNQCQVYKGGQTPQSQLKNNKIKKQASFKKQHQKNPMKRILLGCLYIVSLLYEHAEL